MLPLDETRARLMGIASVPALRLGLWRLGKREPGQVALVHVELEMEEGPRWLHLPILRQTHPGDGIEARMARLLVAEVVNHLAMSAPRRVTLWAEAGAEGASAAAVRVLLAEAPDRGLGLLRAMAARFRQVEDVPIEVRPWDGREAPATRLPPVVPTGGVSWGPGRWVGVDVGGSDVKVVVVDDGGWCVGFAHTWRLPPARMSSADGWAPALAVLVRAAVAAADGHPALDALCRADAPLEALSDALVLVPTEVRVRGIGLSFPDLVVGREIRGGMSGKVAGIREALGGDTPAFRADLAAFLAPLPRLLSARLGGVPVVPIADGQVGAVLVGLQRKGGAAGCLSLGTSVALGWSPGGGGVAELPLYISHLQIDLDDEGARHDTTGHPGVAQKGATQKGVLERWERRTTDARSMPDTSNKGLFLKEKVATPPPDKARLRAWMDAAVDPSGPPEASALASALVAPLADTVAEAAYCLGMWRAEGLGWGVDAPPRWELFGRLVEGADGPAPSVGRRLLEGARARLDGWVDGVGVLVLDPASAVEVPGLPAEHTVLFGQAWGAALFAARETDRGYNAPVALGRGRRVQEALSALRAPDWRGYDVLIVTAATESERRGQARRLGALFEGAVGRSGAPMRVLSILEEWPGGAGNLLGTLHAWERACVLAREAHGLDLEAGWCSGGLRIAMVHNGGSGKRCSPLAQSENNARGSLRLPGVLPGRGGEVPWRLLEAVAVQIQPFAHSNDGEDLDVFWSSQIFFGDVDLASLAPSPFLLTKLCRGLPPAAGVRPDDLRDLGLFEADPHGRVLDFFAQGTFQDLDGFRRWRQGAPSAAFDLGSFRIKRALFHALGDLFAPQLRARQGSRDLDPHLTQPLVALLGALGRAPAAAGAADVAGMFAALSAADRLRLGLFPTVGEVAALLLAHPRWMDPEARVVGLTSVGEAPLHWRYRRPSELREAALGLLGDPGGDPGGEVALRRAFHGIHHPIHRSWLGEVWVEGPELSWEAVARGVDVGGVWIRGSITRGSRLLAGSRIEGSVLEEVTGEIEAEEAVLYGVVAPRLRCQRGLLYRVARQAEGPPVVDGARVGVYRAALPGGVEIGADFEADGKAVDRTVLEGNPFDFAALREGFPTPPDHRGWYAARAAARRRLGLDGVGRESDADLLLDLCSPTLHSWVELAEDVPSPLTPGLARRLAEASVARLLTLVSLHGPALLPDASETDPPSPPAVEARALLGLLADISAHPEPEVARAAAGPLFGGLLEALNDTLTEAHRTLSARVLHRVFDAVRRHPTAAAFDACLSRFGVHTEADLARHHADVRRRGREGAPAPADARRVLVLPRVTLGAEIAINTAILSRLLRRFPAAEILLLADPKVAPLVEGHPRVRVLPLRFARRGGLLDRLQVWVELATRLPALEVDLVVGPDSRVDQVGCLPLTGRPERYLFWENSLGGGERPRPMAELVSAWMDRVFGVDTPALPTLWLGAGPRALGAAVWAALDLDRRPVVSVKLDVGGLDAKALGPAFEAGLLDGLLAAGYGVLLDRGFDAEELARAAAHVARVRAAGIPVVEITDLPSGGVGADARRMSLSPLDPRRPALVVFHGSIGGWAGLTARCTTAFGYDSVHQHLAAAERGAGEGGDAVPGCATVVAFAGHPVPWFPQVWRPVGRAPIRVVEARRDAPSEALAGVLRALRELCPPAAPPPVCQVTRASCGPELELPPSTRERLLAQLPDAGVYRFLRRRLIPGDRLRLLRGGDGAPWGRAVPDPSGPLLALTVPGGDTRPEAVLAALLCVFGEPLAFEDRASWAPEVARAALAGGPDVRPVEARWEALITGPRRRLDLDRLGFEAHLRGAAGPVEGGLDLLGWLRSRLEPGAECPEGPLDPPGVRLLAVSEALDREVREGRVDPALLTSERWVFPFASPGFAGGRRVWMPSCPLDLDPLEFEPERVDGVATHPQVVEGSAGGGLDGAVAALVREVEARRDAGRRRGEAGHVAVGIVGSAGAGKTTLARALAAALKVRGLAAVYSGADAWLWPGEGLRYQQEGPSRRTFLAGPTLLDDGALGSALDRLRAGLGVDLPADDKAGIGPRAAVGADVVVCDGVALGLDPALRRRFDLLVGVWVDRGSERGRLESKLARDTAPDAPRRIDVVTDFAEKVFRETSDGVVPVLTRWADVVWVRSEGVLWWRIGGQGRGRGAGRGSAGLGG